MRFFEQAALLIVALLCLCTNAKSSEPTDVSVVQLIANPQQYDGKQVRLIAFLNLEFEGNALYLHREDFDKSILPTQFGFLWMINRFVLRPSSVGGTYWLKVSSVPRTGATSACFQVPSNALPACRVGNAKKNENLPPSALVISWIPQSLWMLFSATAAEFSQKPLLRQVIL